MIVHDEAACRFNLKTPEGTAYVEYAVKGGIFTILHTIVPKPMEGRGLAAELVSASVAWAEEEGLSIASVCSYADAWLRRHRP